jgi:hypothetical protein
MFPRKAMPRGGSRVSDFGSGSGRWEMGPEFTRILRSLLLFAAKNQGVAELRPPKFV